METYGLGGQENRSPEITGQQDGGWICGKPKDWRMREADNSRMEEWRLREMVA